MSDFSVPFVSQSWHLSDEEYRERRDKTTAEQLRLLQQSPAFVEHLAKKKGTTGGWNYLFLLISFLLLAPAAMYMMKGQQGAAQSWAPSVQEKIESAIDPLNFPIGAPVSDKIKTGDKEMQRTETQPDDPIFQLQAKLADQQTEVSAAKTELQRVATERELLRASEAALKNEVEYNQRAIEKLSRELELEKEKSRRAQHHDASTPKIVTTEHESQTSPPEEEDIDSTPLWTAVAGLTTLSSFALMLRSRRQAKRLREESAQIKTLVARCKEEAASLQADLERANAENEEITEENQQLNDQVARCKEEAASLQADLERANGENETIAEENQQLDDQASEFTQRWDQAEAEYLRIRNGFEAERDALATQNAQLQAEVEELKVLVAQLTQAAQGGPQGLQEFPDPGDDITTFFTPGSEAMENGNGHATTDSDIDRATTEGADRAPTTAAAASPQPGGQAWSGLNDRIAIMREQINMAREKGRFLTKEELDQWPRPATTPPGYVSTGTPRPWGEQEGQGEAGPSSSKDESSSDRLARLAKARLIKDGTYTKTMLEVDVKWLTTQNEMLEAQLDQVTKSLADVVNSKAQAEAKSMNQAQDMDDLAVLLSLKEDDNAQLQRQVEAVKHIGRQLLDWITRDQKPPQERLSELQSTLEALPLEPRSIKMAEFLGVAHK